MEGVGISIRVSGIDNGFGIEPRCLDKIFERFYRIDASRGLVEGSGLGLPIVRQIIDMHKGKIEVESEVGKGSTFKLIFDNIYN